MAFEQDRFDEAVGWWAKSSRANPDFGMIGVAHAITLALAGRIEEAGPVLARALEAEPQIRIRTIREIGLDSASIEKFVRGARLLGIPE